jgi:YYY domain-containing protein
MSEDTQRLVDRSAGSAEPVGRSPFGNLTITLPARETLVSERFLIGVALAVILIFAGLLRLTALNWDSSHHLHPDERFLTSVTNDSKIPGSIAAYFNTSTSQLNPYNLQNNDSFVYGTLPLFLGKIATNLTGPLPFVGNHNSYDGIAVVGRGLSSLFDIGTVVFIFLAARRLFGARAGLLAGLLYAFSPLPIQHAHFYVVDSFMTFFSIAAVYYSIRIVQDGRRRDYALAGLMVGFAVASKLTAVSLMPVVGLAAIVRAWPAVELQSRRLWKGETVSLHLPRDRTLGHAGRGALAAIALAFIVFRIAQPYAFQAPGVSDLALWRDDFHCQGHKCTGVTQLAGRVLNLNPQWVDNQINQQSLLDGGSWPPNVQWIGRTHWVWPLQQMIVWGMGPALGVTAWLGFFYVAWQCWRKRELVLLVPLVWVAGYFFYMGGQFTLYLRYFLPLYPALIIFAAALLMATWSWAANAELPSAVRRRVRLGPGVVPAAVRTAAVAVPVVTVLWGLAYFHIYSKPVTRIEASAWMFANVPSGATIAIEHWDDSVPFSLAGIGDASRYNFVTMNNYDPDNEAKVNELISNLDQVDYITTSSDRLVKTIPRAPANYPITTKYYEDLFNGSLGFKKVAEFTSYPSVLGITIPDRGAEEAWNVYDHPPVEVFQKTSAYSHDRAVAVLGAESFTPGLGLTPKQAAKNGLMLAPADLKQAQNGGTFTSIFSDHSIPNRIPLWTWLVVIEVISFSVLPITLLLFRALPDRGYLLAKPLGFLLLGYLVWLGATLKLVDFTRGTISVVLLVMLLAGGIIAYLTRVDLKAFFRNHWRSIMLWESLFLGAFLVLYIIRINDPDLWQIARGGEKPMDFAYFNAVTRSTSDPPYDPWFAGGYLNYYYFGQWLAATLTKFTGILPEVSYNLVVPLFFSLAVGAAYSLGFNLAEATRRFAKRRPRGGRIGPTGPVLAGLATVFLILVVGNLGGAKELVDNLSKISPWHTNPQINGHQVPGISGLVGAMGGIEAIVFGGKHLNLPTDWYWAPSRMMTPKISITEFPYFTFLFADLHAHLMAIPFAITSLAVGIALVLNATRLMRDSDRYRAWASWGMVFALALLVGALRWINSWDYPPFLIMAIASIFIAERARAGRFDWPVAGRAALKTAVLLGLTLLLFYPFQAHYQLPATGFHVMDQRETTPFHQYLAHFGVFLFIIIGYLAFLMWRNWRRVSPIRALRNVSATYAALLLIGAIGAGTASWLISHSPLPFSMHGLSANLFLKDTIGGILAPLPGATPVYSTDTSTAHAHHATPVVAFALLGIALVLLLGFATLKRGRSDGAIRLFVLSMLGLGLFLSAGVEMVALDGDIQRMNTVFKFYIHVWILFAAVAAFGAWYIFDVIRPEIPLKVSVPRTGIQPARVLRPAFAVCVVGFVAAAVIYPLFATPARVRDRFDNQTAIQPRTNNGLAYMNGAIYGDQSGQINLVDDYAAIQWLRHNVQGSPTIIEAQTPNYRWGGRISINTGLPTVIGWGFHQEQQRGVTQTLKDLIKERESDVGAFYSATDPAEAQLILDKYNVKYVILGEVEQLYYPGQGLTNIQDGLGGMLQKVFEYGQTQVYEVLPNPLLATANTQ